MGAGFYYGEELIARVGLDSKDKRKVGRLVFGGCRGCDGYGIVKREVVWDRCYKAWCWVNRFLSRWIEVRGYAV